MKNQINSNKINFLTPIKNCANTTADIQLFVRGLDGKTITVEVKKERLILRIKEQVFEKTKIPILEQRLLFGGKELKDNLTISNSNLQNGNALDLTLRLRGGVGEFQGVQEFIKAKIVHGNVNKLTTPESIKAIKTKREDKKLRDTLSETLSSENMDKYIQGLYVNYILTDTLKGGNCDEMAEWTAIQLIENTNNQFVYLCSLEGSYIAKKEIKYEDIPPTLLQGNGNIDNKFYHTFLITYPENVKFVSEMDLNKATVVDTWYNHLVCSLADYMKTMHPYYSYQYAENNKLSLETSNILIRTYSDGSSCAYATLGKAIVTKEVKDNLTFLIKDNTIDKELDNSDISDSEDDFDSFLGNNLDIQHAYDFRINKKVRDSRSKENLEHLLLEAYKNGKHMDEVKEFSADTFKEILKSKNNKIINIWSEALALLCEKKEGTFLKMNIDLKEVAIKCLIENDKQEKIASILYHLSSIEGAALISKIDNVSREIIIKCLVKNNKQKKIASILYHLSSIEGSALISKINNASREIIINCLVENNKQKKIASILYHLQPNKRVAIISTMHDVLKKDIIRNLKLHGKSEKVEPIIAQIENS